MGSKQNRDNSRTKDGTGSGSGSGSGSGGTAAQSALIEKIKALIAKAESSPFPAEADAFMEKAQGLINQYAIDESNLDDFESGEVGHEFLDLKGPYSSERSMIWDAVAKPNRCRILTQRIYRSSKVSSLILVGRQQDREIVKLMAFSLEGQALSRLRSLPDDSVASPVVQRRSFLRGFAMEISRRMKAQQRLKESLDRSPVVQDKSCRALERVEVNVDRYLQDEFDVQTSRTRKVLSDGQAFASGKLAGANADVGSSRLATNRKALGRG